MDKRDREILRDLAKRVAEICALPEQETRRGMWYRHNALKPERPMTLCFPEGAWRELLPQSELKASDEFLRNWEWALRAAIYNHEHIHDDQVKEPVFNVGYSYEQTDCGVRTEYVKSENLGAYSWVPPLKNLEDMDKLKFREIIIDRKKTEENLELANELFGDILKVRLRGGFWWSLGMTWDLILLRGLDQVMFDIYDNPEWLHRLMSFLRDDNLRKIEYLEQNGLLCLNNEGDYVGSGGLGYTRELPKEGYDGRVRLRDMWGFGESQEFVGVGAEKFREFVLQYQIPILSKFGLNCYGCCEPLDKKFGLVKQIPNLRRVSISSWSDLELSAGELKDKYIFSWKPNPADMATIMFDEDRIRKGIRNMLEITKGCVVEIIMKDTHTVNGDVSRFDKWTKIAQEEVAKCV